MNLQIRNILFLLTLGLLLIYSIYLISISAGKGLDITDESYYLQWAMHPEDVSATVTQFGHYTNILLRISGKKIQKFRLLGLLVLLVSACLFSKSLVLYLVSSMLVKIDDLEKIKIMLAIVTSVLIYYNVWLLTPSYNWLNLVGLLLFSSGQLYSLVYSRIDDYNRKYILSILLVAIGSFLVLMAKASTFILLVPIAIYWIYKLKLNNKRFYLLVSGIFFMTLFVSHIILFESSVYSYISEIYKGILQGKYLGSGHTLESSFFSIYKDFTYLPKYIFKKTPFLIIVLVYLGAYYLSKKKIIEVRKYSVSLILVSVLMTWSTLYVKNAWIGGEDIGTYLGYPILALSITMLAYGVIIEKLFSDKLTDKSVRVLSSNYMALYFMLVILSVSYGFGSSLGIIRLISSSFIFIVATIMIVSVYIDQKYQKRLLVNLNSFLVIITCVLILKSAHDNPYRLPEKLENNTEKLDILNQKDIIYIDKRSKEYFLELRSVAFDNGWKEGENILDLTGGTPAVAVILGGRALGTPWLIGAYEGSQKFVQFALNDINPEILSSAWILTATDGARRINENVLVELGLCFPTKYEKVGEIQLNYRNEKQILWKPLSM